MLNYVVLMGRIAHELELKKTNSDRLVISFNLAVERSYAKQGEERQADFISCVAWESTAQFIHKYFGKGRMIALEGTLRQRVYTDKTNVKHYVTEVLVNQVHFTGEPKDKSSGIAGDKSASQSTAKAQPEKMQEAISIGSLQDFEEIFDGDTPF